MDLGIFYVTVYDNAFPNRVGEISFDNYNYPEHSTWKYIDMGTYFGSIDTLTFLDPSAVYEFESTEGFALFGGKTSSNSLGNLFHAALDHISSDAGTARARTRKIRPFSAGSPAADVVLRIWFRTLRLS